MLIKLIQCFALGGYIMPTVSQDSLLICLPGILAVLTQHHIAYGFFDSIYAYHIHPKYSIQEDTLLYDFKLDLVTRLLKKSSISKLKMCTKMSTNGPRRNNK